MIESWLFFTAPSMHVNGPLVDLVADRVRVGMSFCIVPINGADCSRCKNWQMAMQKP